MDDERLSQDTVIARCPSRRTITLPPSCRSAQPIATTVTVYTGDQKRQIAELHVLSTFSSNDGRKTPSDNTMYFVSASAFVLSLSFLSLPTVFLTLPL